MVSLLPFLVLSLFLVGATRAWSLSRFWRRGPGNKDRLVCFPKATEDGTIHHHFMQQALKQAELAGQKGEVPIGALVVRNLTAASLRGEGEDQSKENRGRKNRVGPEEEWLMEILSTGANSVETDSDASAHAELVALRRAAARIGNWRLLHCTLYTTLEPCPMCLSASLGFRIESIVFGAPDLRLGAIQTHTQMLKIPHPFHNVTTVEGGVLERESAQLLRDFFRSRRQQASNTATLSKEGSKSFFRWRRPLQNERQ
jgi:tRNA(adenine34) deaminase